MATLREMNERLQNFDTKKVLMDVFMDSNDKVIEKNIEGLMEGKGKDGQPLRQYAWQEYAEWKHELNPKAGKGNPDLKVSGSYHKSFYTEGKGGTEYEIKSNDAKAPFLDEHYDNMQYGMNPEKKGEFVKETYRPALRKRIKELLKL